MTLLRALIVEDYEDDALLVEEALIAAGYNVHAHRVDTGDTLRQALRDEQWDIIFADYSLPSFSAQDTITALRETGLDIPVIVVSGTVGEDVAVQTLKLGAEDYLLKQNLTRLAPAVRNALDTAEHRRQRHKLESIKKEIEDSLREKTALLEALVESAPLGILVTDRHGNKLIQNRLMNEMWKIPPGIAANPDDRQQREWAVKQGKDPEKLAKLVYGLDDNMDEVVSHEIELANGTVLERYSAPVRDKEGHYYGRTWMFNDVTEERRREQRLHAALKMEAIGSFAAGIAHDFNNILAIIRLNAQLIAQDTASYESEIQEILQTTGRARDLVEEILGIANHQHAPHTRIDLRAPVAEAVKMLKSALPANVTLEDRLFDQSAIITGNATQILRLVLNLGKNAIESMAGQPGTLAIILENGTVDAPFALAHPPLRPGPAFVLTVKDTGSGMDPATLARIFEPFFSTKGSKGTGLGLPLVLGIVQQHSGAILVESVPGAGTTFTLWFPSL